MTAGVRVTERRGEAGRRFSLLIAALRLPFVSASALPFIAGTVLARPAFSPELFLLGLVSVVAAHLGANLLNDVGDSRTGLDWKDLNSYGFFGGSKLIQQGKLSERFYRSAAAGCFVLALTAAARLTVALQTVVPLVLLAVIGFLAAQYSLAPLRFSYRCLGEPVVFLLFGPALVMGGYYLQTGDLFSLRAFLLSLPFGLLVSAILVANEIPDYAVDKASGKRTWVALTGAKFSYLLYGLLIIAGILSVGVNIGKGTLSRISWLSLLALIPAGRALGILKRSYDDTWRCVDSSRATIMVFTGIAVLIIIDLIV